jgi:hypothetical protein
MLGSNNGWFLAVSVQDECKVELPNDVNSLVNKDGINEKTVFASLVCY